MNRDIEKMLKYLIARKYMPEDLKEIKFVKPKVGIATSLEDLICMLILPVGFGAAMLIAWVAFF